MCFEIDAPFSSAESAVLCCGVFGGLFSGGLLLFSSSCCGLSWFGFGFLVCYFNWELFLFVVWGILMFFWRALCFSLLLLLFLEVFGVCWFVSFPFPIETEKIRRLLPAPLWLMLLEIKKTVGSPVPQRHKNSINTGLGAQLECLLSLDTWPVGLSW